MRISDWSSDVCSSDLLELEPHPRLLGLLDGLTAVGHGTLQTQDLGGRRGEIHMDRVDLLEGGERLRLPVRYQAAFSHERATDPARDRRTPLHVYQINVTHLHIYLRLHPRGPQLAALPTGEGGVGC